jgi:hypothetical protein
MPLPPYQSRPYDYGPTSRLSDLIRQRGSVGAEAELRNAAVRSRMAQDLAGVASQTLSSLAKYQEDAPRREAQTLALEEGRARKADRATTTALNEAFNGTLARFTAKDPETGGLTVKWDELEAAFAQSPNAADLVPRLHQYEGVKAAQARMQRHEGGVIWHTQGSGKSLLMAFFAGMLVHHEELQNPTLVVLTDRNDLDDQLFGQFQRCHDIVGQMPVAVTRSDCHSINAVRDSVRIGRPIRNRIATPP